MTIIEFINARLDEDEAIAREANRDGTYSGEWEHHDLETGLEMVYDESIKVREAWKGGGLEDVAQLSMPYVAEHIARHDPARVLRQVQAMRKIVKFHAALIEMWKPNKNYGLSDTTIRGIASIWSDHPDYQREWRDTE